MSAVQYFVCYPQISVSYQQFYQYLPSNLTPHGYFSYVTILLSFRDDFFVSLGHSYLTKTNKRRLNAKYLSLPWGKLLT